MLPITQANPPPGVIDFGIGQPGTDLLPLHIIREAAARRLADSDPTFLNYGYNQGDGRFRLALAEFLTEQYGFSVSPDTLLVTAGVSQALDLICTLFTRAGDTILVEDPTYFLALQLFADHGLQVTPVPTDEDGLQVEALPALLAAHRPVFLYTIPAFQNPSGVTLSPERRQTLLDYSEVYDFFIVADEVYQLLGYTATPPPPLARFIDSERVFSLGSFSKILAPGLRVGWIQAASRWMETLAGSGVMDSGGSPAQFAANVARVVLDQGWQTMYLADLRETYRRRVAAMDAALARHLPGAVYRTPGGGFFFWVRLEDGEETAVLSQHALTHQVGFRSGDRFSAQNQFRRHARLSFAFYDEAQIEQGIIRLGRLVAARGNTGE